MDKINVTVHVIPDRVNVAKLLTYEPEKDGTAFSTLDKLSVNKTDDGYSILYKVSDFMKLDQPIFMKNLIKIFMSNLGNDIIIAASVDYDYEELLDTHYDDAAGRRVLELCQLMKGIDESGRYPMFKYTESKNIFDMMDVDMDDDSDDEDDKDDDDDDLGKYLDILGINSKGPNGSFLDDIDDDKNKNKKKSHEYYGRSRVLKNSKNPKRDIHRHGVIIASKSDIAQDKKIIKKFLKDFIPGKSHWKKEFRQDIVKRWMKMYSISKSDLKDLEKKQRRKNAPKHQNKYVANAINMTSRLISQPLNNDWFNPNK